MIELEYFKHQKNKVFENVERRGVNKVKIKQLQKWNRLILQIEKVNHIWKIEKIIRKCEHNS